MNELYKMTKVLTVQSQGLYFIVICHSLSESKTRQKNK